MKTQTIAATLLAMAMTMNVSADDSKKSKQIDKEMDVRVEVVKDGEKSVKKVWINGEPVDLSDKDALHMLGKDEQVLVMQAGKESGHQCKHHEGKEGAHECKHRGEEHGMKHHKMIKIKSSGTDGHFKAVKHILSSAQFSDEQKAELRELLK